MVGGRIMGVEVSYTGGGIWLAEKDLGNGTYAVVDSEYHDCLSIYQEAEEHYMPEDMILSEGVANLDLEQMKIYRELVNALKEKTELAHDFTDEGISLMYDNTVNKSMDAINTGNEVADIVIKIGNEEITIPNNADNLDLIFTAIKECKKG